MAEQIKSKSLWDKYTNWAMENIFKLAEPYFNGLPHFSKKIRKTVADIIVILFYIGLFFTAISVLGIPFMLLGGIAGVISAIAVAFEFYGMLASMSEIKAKTQKGWEYLVALSSLGLLVSLVEFGVGFFAPVNKHIPAVGVYGLITNLIVLAISYYILIEVKSEFK